MTNKIDLMNIKTIKKISELSTRIDEAYQNKEEMTQSDLQGVIEAIIINAMQFERG